MEKIKMAKYHERYEFLILVAAFSGLYFSPVEKIIKNKFALKIVKLIPIFPLTMLPLFLISQLKYLLIDEGEILTKLYSFVIIFFCILTNLIVFSFYMKRSEYVRLLELWDDSFADELFPEELEKLLREKSRMINKFVKIFTVLTVIGNIVYTTLSGFSKSKTLTHPSGIPYRKKSPDFELILVFHFFNALFGYFGPLVYELLMMVFFSLEEIQLRHLKSSLARILDVDESEKTIVKSSNCGKGNAELWKFRKEKIFVEAEEKIRIWIIHHQRALRLQGEVQRIYGVTLSIQYIFFASFLCLTCFLSATGRFRYKDVFAAIVFCFNLFSVFYLNIQISDSIAELGQTLFGDAFGKGWHLHPSRTKTLLKIIVLRAHKSFPIKTLVIYPFDSSTFQKVLAAAYSIITFLLQISKKKRL